MDQLLILFRGLPGTGKTFLINKISELYPRIVVLSRDETRLKLFKDPEYTKEENEIINALLLVLVNDNLKNGCSVVIDGMTFSMMSSISPFINHAVKHNVLCKIIECECFEETSIERITKDLNSITHPAGDRNTDLYYRIKKKYQKINYPLLKIITDDPVELNIQKIVDYLES
jgi:predicted kinase